MSSGSTIPGPLQEDPGPKPDLRDDIVVPAIVGEKVTAPQAVRLTVASPALRREVGVEILLPADNSVPRPALYMLEGVDAGEKSSGWMTIGGAPAFFADKNVNVVTPLEGAFSYYTDWQKDDPVLGRNKWQTFLTRELPPVIDAQFGTNGVNSIAAISMTATSVLNLAISAPGLYRSVGAYSGCAETSTQPGQDYVRLVVGARGGADPTNMWGPFDGPGWRENDPVVNAEKLRGTALYVSTGSGLPGPHDNLQAPDVNGNPGALLNQIVVGGIIESAVNGCTHGLADRLNALGIPATFDFKPTGTHSWGYWQDDLHNSWPMIAGSMGAQ